MVHLPEVRAELVFETSDALSTIDFMGTALDGVVNDFSSSFGTAISGIQSDFGSVADGISTGLSGSVGDAIAGLETDLAGLSDTQISPTVTADTSDASAAIDDLSSVPVDVEVSADTADAEASISDLGESAEGSTGELDGLSAAASGVSAAAGLASGETSALEGAVGKLGPQAAAGVAVVGGLAGIFGTLFNAGVDAESQIQRFNTTLGDQAPVVENVRVGNLTTTLAGLANKLGSTDSDFKNSIATIYAHGAAAGFSDQQNAAYADGLGALGARAVAINPNLGSLADVTTNIERALARGGPALAQYGISLAAADINAKALEQTGKTAPAQLTAQEKAYAGLTLATAKYGDTLKEKIEEGSKNPLIQQNKLKATFADTLAELGKPLIAPIFELMKKLLPIAAEFGKVFSELGKAIIPALIPALEASLPTLQLFGQLMQILAPVLRPVLTIFLLMSNPILAVTFAIQHFDEILNVLSSTLGPVLSAIGGFFTGIFDGAVSVVGSLIGFFTALPGDILGALGDIAGTLFGVGVAILTAQLNGARAVVGELLGFFSGLPGAILGAIGDVGGLLFNVGRDLLQGLIDGATSILGDVEDFLGGVTDDITSWKGPPAKDKVLLFPAGQLIMGGLIEGVQSALPMLQATLGGVTQMFPAAVPGVGVGATTAGVSNGGGGIGPSQTNNFYGYSPQETAAVNGREWTRMTRFAGV